MAKKAAAPAAISFRPECSHPVNGYGIGNCVGCSRYPIVIYKMPGQCWRCERCCTQAKFIPGFKVLSS